MRWCCLHRGAADGRAGIAILGDVAFEFRDFIAENEMLFGEHAVDSGVDFVRNRLVLRGEIDERDGLNLRILTGG